MEKNGKTPWSILNGTDLIWSDEILKKNGKSSLYKRQKEVKIRSN